MFWLITHSNLQSFAYEKMGDSVMNLSIYLCSLKSWGINNVINIYQRENDFAMTLKEMSRIGCRK